MRTLLILRAHKADADTLAAYDRYAALPTADVVICCDERNGAVDMGGRDKIGFDAERLRALGLFLHPRAGWRCGDYAYYVTRAVRPDYDFYWLTEPDVVINTADLDATFGALNATDADLLAPRLYERDNRWGWTRTMRSRYTSVYGCIFPITRLSGRAIDHLHAARRESSAEETNIASADWPNDEVFVATEMMSHDFSCKDIVEQHAGSYTRDSLRTGLPHDRALLQSRAPDEMIYHPVRDFGAWFEEKSEWLADYGQTERNTSARERGPMRHLLGMAVGALENAALRDAALLPLMLARGRPVTSPPFADYEQMHRCMVRMLEATFSTGRNRHAFATAYLLGEPAADLPEITTRADDFPLDSPFSLFALPTRYALPYAFDFNDQTLLFTIHPKPEAVLSAASVLAEQRDMAAVGCKVAWQHLQRFFPGPPEDLDTIVLTDPLAAAEVRALGYVVAAMPPALLQLLADPERLSMLRPALRRSLLWSAMAPALAFGRAAFLVAGGVTGGLEKMVPGVRVFRRK